MCSEQASCDVVRTDVRPRLAPRAVCWDAMRLLVLIAVCLVCVFGWGVYRFGSIGMTRAYLSGFVIAAETPVIDLGEVRSGQEVTVEFRLQNLSARPVTILGANSDCGCLVLDLPKTVNGSEVTSLRVGFAPTSRQEGTQISHTAALTLDTDAPPVLLRTVAQVIKTE